MIVRHKFLTVACAIGLSAGALTVATLPQASEAQQRPARAAPAIVLTPEGGIRMGGATARVRLIEYVSYTCPHCASFDAQSRAAMPAYLRRGMSIEVRPVVRDVIDLASATLARCGPVPRFFARHHAIMDAQATTLSRAESASAGWAAVPAPQRLSRIARDTGLTTLVAAHGVPAAAAEACLADQAALRRLIAVSEASLSAGVESTPSFAINGTLVPHTHDWAALSPRLDAAFAAR